MAKKKANQTKSPKQKAGEKSTNCSKNQPDYETDVDFENVNNEEAISPTIKLEDLLSHITSLNSEVTLLKSENEKLKASLEDIESVNSSLSKRVGSLLKRTETLERNAFTTKPIW